MSMIGKSLAHYEVNDQIGKGGMGEVYRAKDSKLGRDVAIKILPEEFALDPDRVARFQREAKLLASLNHPNIAAIHGLEDSDGLHFLVMELIEGQTLADRIKSGPIPVEEALKYALQMAEALEAAHENGVIHRDLKPANIKVTPDGKVKVLDFGLAKAFAGDEEDVNLPDSPTLSARTTRQGVILGTAAYMSPEQAKGKSVDKRADIWAFGAVLFEMLTGEQAFPGDDVSEVLASVIKADSNLALLPENIHTRVREVLTRCLQKDLRKRYSGIADARYEIEQALADPSGVLVQPVVIVESRSRLRTILPWIAAVVILSAITGAIVWKLKPSELRQVTRISYDLPKDQQLSDFARCAVAISPDGRQIVYSTVAGLYLRSMEEMDARLLPGTGGTGQRPFFSPDGKWVGFFSSTDNKLKKIATSGGAPVTLADVTLDFGTADWNADDTIVYGQSEKGLFRVSANGGTPEQIIKVTINDPTLYDPQILPDGESVLFTGITVNTQKRTSTYDPPMQFKVIVQSLKSGERKELFEGASGRYLPTGHIVYSLENSILAVPFDIDALKVTGGPVSMVEGALWYGIATQYAVSDSGTLVYITGMGSDSDSPLTLMLGLPPQISKRTLVWVDRKGNEEPLAVQPDKYRSPTISPDGTKVAVSIGYSGLSTDIWIWDIVRETMTRLTFDGAGEYPLWSIDGQRIAFWSVLMNAVHWKAADGTGDDEKLGSVPDRMLLPCSWSSDGKTIVAREGSPTTSENIGSVSMEGDHEWKPLLQEKYNEDQPEISPDGQWMAYSSNESGKNEIYVRPFPDVNKGRWQISTAGGDSPLWSPDGRELFYQSGDAVMAVAVETEPAFKAGKPETLFRGTNIPFSPLEGNSWDISPDGKRFLMIKEVAPDNTVAGAEETSQKINIVLNWIEELKERVPVE